MSTRTGQRIRHLVSIGDPADRPPAGYGRIISKLRLLFHDLEEDTDLEFGPARHHIEALISFVRRISNEGGQLLIHCGAGISRSTAAALIVYAVWLGPGREEDAVAAMLRAKPDAFPNRLMVRLADELLERNGSLTRAVEER